MAYKNIECITYNVTVTDPVDILNYSTYSKFDTRWYANTLKVTNVSSSVATLANQMQVEEPILHNTKCRK